jgi:hypothetical protein
MMRYLIFLGVVFALMLGCSNNDKSFPDQGLDDAQKVPEKYSPPEPSVQDDSPEVSDVDKNLDQAVEEQQIADSQELDQSSEELENLENW